jgi:hypothetical protein
MTAGEIVIGHNSPGNPKALKAQRANPGVNLPHLDITVARCADSSGPPRRMIRRRLATLLVRHANRRHLCA